LVRSWRRGVASANGRFEMVSFSIFSRLAWVWRISAFVGVSFRDRMATPTVLRGERGGRSSSNSALKEIKDTLSTPGVWLLSLFFFSFLGLRSPLEVCLLWALYMSCETNCIRLDGRVPCQCP
jgi:hypothetical protein